MMKSIQERLHNLAEVLGMAHEGVVLSLEQDRDRRWWLVGCTEGDCVLPRAKRQPTTGDAIEAAEAWLAPELMKLAELEHEQS